MIPRLNLISKYDFCLLLLVNCYRCGEVGVNQTCTNTVTCPSGQVMYIAKMNTVSRLKWPGNVHGKKCTPSDTLVVSEGNVNRQKTNCNVSTRGHIIYINIPSKIQISRYRWNVVIKSPLKKESIKIQYVHCGSKASRASWRHDPLNWFIISCD
jgi:hypothetical protein